MAISIHNQIMQALHARLIVAPTVVKSVHWHHRPPLERDTGGNANTPSVRVSEVGLEGAGGKNTACWDIKFTARVEVHARSANVAADDASTSLDPALVEVMARIEAPFVIADASIRHSIVDGSIKYHHARTDADTSLASFDVAFDYCVERYKLDSPK